MRFGLHLQSHAPPSGLSADTYPHLRERARWGEEAGFAAVCVLDHLEPFAAVGERTMPMLEGWGVLGALATATERVELLTLVSNVSMRAPSLLARAGATLDHISGGRMVMGVGSGGYRPEYDAHGQPYPSFAKRTRLLEETILALRALWESPRATFEGQMVRLHDAVCEPKPLHRPRVLVGGRSSATLAVAGRHADALNALGAGPGEAARLAVRMGEMTTAAGRAPGAVTLTLLERVVMGRTPQEARERWVAAGSPQRAGHRGLAGTPDEVIAQVRAYEQAGVAMLFVHFPPADEASADLFARKVLPAFAT